MHTYDFGRPAIAVDMPHSAVGHLPLKLIKKSNKKKKKKVQPHAAVPNDLCAEAQFTN